MVRIVLCNWPSVFHLHRAAIHLEAEDEAGCSLMMLPADDVNAVVWGWITEHQLRSGRPLILPGRTGGMTQRLPACALRAGLSNSNVERTRAAHTCLDLVKVLARLHGEQAC